MKHLLPKLTAALEEFKAGAQEIPVPPFSGDVPQEASEILTHSWFWPRVGKFFKPKDVVVAETGTSSFGMIDVPVRFPMFFRGLQ